MIARFFLSSLAVLITECCLAQNLPNDQLENFKRRYNATEIICNSKGIPTFIVGSLSNPRMKSLTTPEEKSFEFFEDNKLLFQMKDASQELKIMRQTVDDLKMTHIRFKQLFQDIEVFGAELLTHFDSTGELRSVNGEFYGGINISVIPSLSSAYAEEVALKRINCLSHKSIIDKPKLIIFPQNDNFYLTWLVRVNVEKPKAQWDFYIDSNKGDIIYKTDNIYTQKAIKKWGKTTPMIRIEILPNKEVKVFNLDGTEITDHPVNKLQNKDSTIAQGNSLVYSDSMRVQKEDLVSLVSSEHIGKTDSINYDCTILAKILSHNRDVSFKENLNANESSINISSKRDPIVRAKLDSLPESFLYKSSSISLSGSPNLALFTGQDAQNGYTYDPITHQLSSTISVQNNGTAPTGSFRIGWYLSTNTTITTQDYLIFFVSQVGLNSGRARNVPGSANLDQISTLPAGSYYLGAYFDDLMQVSESNENDNAVYWPTPLDYTNLPNLTVYTGSGSNNTYTYDDQTHSLNSFTTVQNNGTCNAGSFRIGWYLSSNTTISTDDYLVASQVVNFLNIGTSVIKDANFNLGNITTLPVGRYYLGIYFDDLFQIKELNEGDNTAYSTSIIDYTKFPNLTLYSGSGSDNRFNYREISHKLFVKLSVQNNGSADAGNFRIGYYLSTDNIITTNDFFISGNVNSTLPVMHALIDSCTIDLKNVYQLAKGNYFIGAFIDDLFQVAESDETDNAVIYSPPIIYANSYEAIGSGIGVMGDTKRHIDTNGYPGYYALYDLTRNYGNNIHNHNGKLRSNQYIATISFTDNYFCSDDNNIWDKSNQAASIDAHVYAGIIYDFMLRIFNRNSFDNLGSSLINVIDNPKFTNNAFWDGKSVNFCPSSFGHRSTAGSLDVVAHEWGHAVTNIESNLVYSKESGALNESFSDMLGVAVGFETGLDPDWQIGENVYFDGTCIRDLSNPGLRDQPDTYKGLWWFNVDCDSTVESNDNCGVHTNSGVPNKMFYLLSQGGVHNGVSVNGIGIINAIKIMYRANSTYWSKTVDFVNAKQGSILAANDLDQSGNWARQTRKAWEAVFNQGSSEVSEYPNLFSAKVYPNITSGMITIESSIQDQNKSNFYIFDILGVSRMSGRIVESISRLDLCRLTPGVYFIKIVDTSGKSSFSKIIRE